MLNFNNMDSDLNNLFQYCMKPIFEKEAKKYGRFLSQEEFEKNMGTIFIITGSIRNIQAKLDKKCN